MCTFQSSYQVETGFTPLFKCQLEIRTQSHMKSHEVGAGTRCLPWYQMVYGTGGFRLLGERRAPEKVRKYVISCWIVCITEEANAGVVLLDNPIRHCFHVTQEDKLRLHSLGIGMFFRALEP